RREPETTPGGGGGGSGGRTMGGERVPDRRPAVGLVGHAYNILDDGLNLSLRDKLRSLGVRLVTPEHYTPSQLDDGARAMLKKPLFWTLGRKLAGAASLMSRDPAIKGMIAVVSFGCGLDSMVIELAERLIRRARPDLPFMLLTLDEHTGEAGLRTRLEAFADLIIRRRAG
ncbi:MAG: hypothetical protein Q8P31_10235, partial [Bacillota bacterium]|nr:hypothetical protein [Bacillota bacterium]